MKRQFCEREVDVLRAVKLGHVDHKLRPHLGECAECRELLEMAGLLDADRRQTMLEAPLPSAGAMWLQMKMRAAREAQIRSTRMMVLIQGGSLVLALSLALAVFGLPAFPQVNLEQATSFSLVLAAVGGATALFALLAPLAVWLALRRSDA